VAQKSSGSDTQILACCRKNISDRYLKGLVMKEIAFTAIMGPEYASLSTVRFVFFFWRFLHDED